MKKLLGIVFLGLLWCNVSFAEISYICTYDETPKLGQFVFEIKKRKLYLEGDFQKTKYLKTSSSKAEFSYEWAYFESDGVTKKRLKRTDGITTHKISLKTGIAIENSKWTTKEWDKSGKLTGNRKESSSETLTCYGGTLNIAKGGDQPKKKKPKQQYPNNKILRASSGTGFFVSKTGNIVTNYHVIDGCKYVTMNFNGSDVKVKTLAIDRKNDLAIINAKVSPKKIYQVSYEDAELLDNVIIAGYPLGKKVSSAIKTSKGSITALAGYGDNYSEFQTDAALNQGNSGGPIINENNGNVIGVAVAAFGKTAGVESFNFGIKSSTLRTFASSNQIKFLPPNNAKLSNKELRELISNGTVYLECWMTYGNIKKIIEAANSQKAFFTEFQ